jgi:hypothetical protein
MSPFHLRFSAVVSGNTIRGLYLLSFMRGLRPPLESAWALSDRVAIVHHNLVWSSGPRPPALIQQLAEGLAWRPSGLPLTEVLYTLGAKRVSLVRQLRTFRSDNRWDFLMTPEAE